MKFAPFDARSQWGELDLLNAFTAFTVTVRAFHVPTFLLGSWLLATSLWLALSPEPLA